MTDKQLIRQLHQLKTIKADSAWKANCREVLRSQISHSSNSSLSAWDNFLINLRSVSSLAYRPVAVIAGFLFLLIGTSVFGHQLFKTSTPNDSLYIARVVSEKAKLSTVIDSASRERLAALFALAHAEEISAILADPNFDWDKNASRVVKLNDDFQKEITIAKNRVTSLNERTNPSQPTISEETSSISPSEEEALLVIADNNKDDNGVQVSATDEPVINDSPVTATTTEMSSPDETATSTELDLEGEVVGLTAEEEIIALAEQVVDQPTATNLLDEIQALFDQAKLTGDKELMNDLHKKLQETKELLQ